MRALGQTGGVASVTDDELSLGAIGRALWRNKRAIIGPTLIMVAAAFVGVNLITPRYKSEARVLVEGRENIFLRPEAEKATIDRSTVDPETVTSQVQLVLSRDLAREVIEQLKLADLPEFNAALKEFSPMSVLRTIGLVKDPMSMSLEERVLAAYFERLNAYAIDKSRVIAIEFQSADPELAAQGHQHDRGEISVASSRWRSRTRRAPPATGCRASSKSCAARSPRPRARSRISAPSPICSSAPTTPAWRTSSSPS